MSTKELDAILEQLRADRQAGRTDIHQPIRVGAYTPLTMKAWRKREKKKRAQENQVLEGVHRRSLAQARYHQKNREHLNRVRALRARVPLSVYRRAKRRATERGQAWLFDFDSWYGLWTSAGKVLDPRSGFEKNAWDCKGGNYTTDTQMVRRDPSGPWCVSNCFISLNGRELVTRPANREALASKEI